jgi:hypothetical protein
LHVLWTVIKHAPQSIRSLVTCRLFYKYRYIHIAKYFLLVSNSLVFSYDLFSIINNKTNIPTNLHNTCCTLLCFTSQSGSLVDILHNNSSRLPRPALHISCCLPLILCTSILVCLGNPVGIGNDQRCSVDRAAFQVFVKDQGCTTHSRCSDNT